MTSRSQLGRRHNVRRLPCHLCEREFRNRSGLTQHVRSSHPYATLTARGVPPPPTSPHEAALHNEVLPEAAEEDDPIAIDHDHNDQNRTPTPHPPSRTVYHPYLDGTTCDIDGNDLPSGAPAPTQADQTAEDWAPFESRIEFETAEFLYSRNQMSAGQIDSLLDLWAASLLKHNDSPPFASHTDLYKTIDSTHLGDTKWDSFQVQYEGRVQAEPAPSWMTAGFEVWYRDPRDVIKTMLGNTDFNGKMDVAPSRHFDKDGNRLYHNFMSADWAWKQAVCTLSVP